MGPKKACCFNHIPSLVGANPLSHDVHRWEYAEHGRYSSVNIFLIIDKIFISGKKRIINVFTLRIQ